MGIRKIMEKKYNYLFGPVPSRRFGRSLGVDLTPYKTCSLDCIFCQLGRTTEKTVERKEYVPTDIVLSELKDWLNKDGEADYITLSGSGEPTLHSRFGSLSVQTAKFLRCFCPTAQCYTFRKSVMPLIVQTS